MFFPSEWNVQREEIYIPTPMMRDNQVNNFPDAVRKRDKNLISCDLKDAFKSTATVKLAMILYNTNSLVRWNATQNEISK